GNPPLAHGGGSKPKTPASPRPDSRMQAHIVAGKPPGVWTKITILAAFRPHSGRGGWAIVRPRHDSAAARFYTARMLKIDSHAHILPRDWPNLAAKYGNDRFPVMTHSDGRHRIYKGGRFFREVWDSAFDPQQRIDDYARFGVDVQVISTVPVLFSYWAPGYQALELHSHLNDHAASL